MLLLLPTIIGATVLGSIAAAYATDENADDEYGYEDTYVLAPPWSETALAAITAPIGEFVDVMDPKSSAFALGVGAALPIVVGALVALVGLKAYKEL